MGQGCTVALGVKVKVKVKVKVMRWDWDRELLTGRTLGLMTEVHHGPYCTVALGCTVALV